MFNFTLNAFACMQTKFALFLEKCVLVMGRGTFKGALCAILEKHAESNSTGWMKMSNDGLIASGVAKLDRKDLYEPGPSFALLRRCAARDESARQPAAS